MHEFPPHVEQHLLRDYGPGDCWGWRGPSESSGYPMINFKGAKFSARRFIKEHVSGPTRPGASVRTECGNVGCVNPEHLK